MCLLLFTLTFVSSTRASEERGEQKKRERRAVRKETKAKGGEGGGHL